jgi:PBP1b-binding outer membrane lipoprotein LpoB
MKKITLTLIATFVATILVGCGSSGKSIAKNTLNPTPTLTVTPTPTSTPTTPTPTPTVTPDNRDRVIDNSYPLPF